MRVQLERAAAEKRSQCFVKCDREEEEEKEESYFGPRKSGNVRRVSTILIGKIAGEDSLRRR